MTRIVSISSDIDTLHSIYHGRGSRRAEYTYAELRMGLEQFSRFLERYRAKSTLFMVGHDFLQPVNHDAIRAVANEGHEIANHSHSHAQGFRLLTAEAQEHEVAQMEAACLAVTGRKPVGFRSPGWNMGDQALPMLQRRGYLYDSSVHPMSTMPAFKALHWLSQSNADPIERTTLGEWSYMFAPLRPYRTSRTHLGRRGADGIVELPMTVVPGVRAPFWATFHLAAGFNVFRLCERILRATSLPVQYMFHLSDFVDYSHPDLADQVPATGGLYVPQSLRMPLVQKLEFFTRVLDVLAENARFVTLEQLAATV